MIAGVVLAAGAGRRFGGRKPLAPLAGEPLVRHAARAAIAAGLAPVIVVVGADGDEVAAALAGLPARVVANRAWADGMASSIRGAVDALAGDPAIAGLALVLADQPRVPVAHLRALAGALDRAPCAATRVGEVVGAPASFARALFPALAALTGDRGARAVVAACAARVELGLDAAAAIDVDTADDLARLA